jgi:cystathionine beta-synthase
MKEKLPNVKIIAVDPDGSILAQPDSLNGPIHSYKVEGIGYDFIPTVLDRSAELVDKWYKTQDKESFLMARRLIKEEGLLCGGSSGSAMIAALRAIKEFKLGAGQRCVVLLPDSVRNYMSKFLNDDWMISNSFIDPQTEQLKKNEAAQWKGATIRELNLPDAICVDSKTTCANCLEIMRKGGFDQVPVVDEKKKMVGLITVGNLLSHVTAGRAKSSDPVTVAMFKFNTKRAFTEITMDTKLADLQGFFENNSAAFVTAREGPDNAPVVKKVVTKVDLVSYLLHGKKN